MGAKPPFNGELGTDARATVVSTDVLELLTSDIDSLVGVARDTAAQQDGTVVYASDSGVPTDLAAWVDGTKRPVTGVEWFDSNGVARPVAEWHLGPPLTPVTIDDFNDGSIPEWTKTRWFWANSGDVLRSNIASGPHAVYSAPGDGLPHYPGAGDIVEFEIKADGSEAGTAAQFLADSSGTPGDKGYPTAYEFRYWPRGGNVALEDLSSGGGLDADYATPPVEEWVRVEIKFEDAAGTVTATAESTSSNYSATLSVPFSAEHGQAIAFWNNNGGTEADNRIDYLDAMI